MCIRFLLLIRRVNNSRATQQWWSSWKMRMITRQHLKNLHTNLLFPKTRVLEKPLDMLRYIFAYNFYFYKYNSVQENRIQVVRLNAVECKLMTDTSFLRVIKLSTVLLFLTKSASAVKKYKAMKRLNFRMMSYKKNKYKLKSN